MPFFLTAAILLAISTLSEAFWLMAMKNILVTERLDPIVNPGTLSPHVHTVVGGSNFSSDVSTADLRASGCTSTPIVEDKSNYWFPTLYFYWSNGSFTSVDGGVVIYYLFTAGEATPFPDDFRMLSGTHELRSYDSSSFAQQAVTFLCLDYSAGITKHNGLPALQCPDGVRSQINFPSCWDGVNVDSADHKSHVSFLSTGPDTGTCSDPNYPVTIPRIFVEVYWDTSPFYTYVSQAMNSSQPFVFSQGDPTGYGYHADFINGWEAAALQRAVDSCDCGEYGDMQCCANEGIFTVDTSTQCYISSQVDEQVTGTLPALPGDNPVQYGPANAVDLSSSSALLSTSQNASSANTLQKRNLELYRKWFNRRGWSS